MAFLMPTKSSTTNPASGMASDNLDNPDYSKPVLAIGDPVQDSKPDDDQVEPPADVETLLKDLAKQIRASHRKIEKSAVAIVEAVVSMGRDLDQARTLLADHNGGTFGKFLASVKVNRMTANRAVRAWEVFGCNSVVQRYELPAIYALSATNTPQTVINQALEMAQDGQTITGKTARGLIEKAIDRPEKPARPLPEVITVQGGTVAVTALDGITVEQILLRAIKQIRDGRLEAA